MRPRRNGWRYGLVGVGVVVALAAVTFAAVPSLLSPLMKRPNPREGLATTPVRRTDLHVTMAAGGRIESANATTIECQLQALDVGVQGRRLLGGGASTILSVVDDGSYVKEGDVLCVLDSSDYVELERVQRMTVDRARADHQQAFLNLEVARTAVKEYRDGLMIQSLKELEGQVTLAKADLELAGDRLVWTRRMVEKGYFPRAQASNDQLSLDRMAFGLKQGLANLRLFKQFSAPKYLHILESDVLAAEATERFQTRRQENQESRLANLRNQIERCTIKAPHDGFLIYANEDLKQIRIEPGLAVRQRQRLFYLPDLAQMEVSTLLHETVVNEVKPGMFARVRVEALGGRELEGHVTSIAQLPVENRFSDVKYYTGKVRLDSIPRGLKPGMSAEVRIQTARKIDVLAVPTEAVVSDSGHDVCYVAHPDHLERREVHLGQATTEMLEITDGLTEGEDVVADASHVSGPAVSGPEEAPPESEPAAPLPAE